MIDQERKRQIREIYERQIDRVYRIALIYTGDPHDAEDVAESVFLTVINRGEEERFCADLGCVGLGVYRGTIGKECAETIRIR